MGEVSGFVLDRLPHRKRASERACGEALCKKQRHVIFEIRA